MKNRKAKANNQKPTKGWTWFLFPLSLKEVGPLVENSDFHKYTLRFASFCYLKWRENIQSQHFPPPPTICFLVVIESDFLLEKSQQTSAKFDVWQSRTHWMEKPSQSISGSRIKVSRAGFGRGNRWFGGWNGTCVLRSSILKIICKISGFTGPRWRKGSI